MPKHLQLSPLCRQGMRGFCIYDKMVENGNGDGDMGLLCERLTKVGSEIKNLSFGDLFNYIICSWIGFTWRGCLFMYPACGPGGLPIDSYSLSKGIS